MGNVDCMWGKWEREKQENVFHHCDSGQVGHVVPFF